MAGPWDFRTPDLLGPSYQALGNLVPNVLSAYKQGLGLFRDNERRQTLSGLGPDASPQEMAGALMKLGDLDGVLAARSLQERMEDRGLARQKMNLELDAFRSAQNERQQTGQMLQGILSGAQQSAAPRPSNASTGDAASAISRIESGGRYDALGPQTRTGDRAYGKYQVMGANIGPWTERYVGRRMTPQEFLASPEAQDAVFQGEFGRLQAKHGPEGAARAWFAGEGGMNDMGRRDILGTTVADYARKFNAGFSGGQPAPQQAAMQTPAPVQFAQAQPQTVNDAAPSSMDEGAIRRLPSRQLEAIIANPGVAKHFSGIKSLAEAELKRREGVNAPTERERNARAAGLKPGTPEYRNYMLNEKPEDSEIRKFNEREKIADRMGLQGQRREYYLANGKLPGGERPSATEQKAIFAAEDELPAIESTISSLRRARELNDKTYTGYTARARAAIGTNLPQGIVPDSIADPVTSANTRELDQILSLEALKQMSTVLKGATTEREMAEFQRILGDPTTPPQLRARTLDRMITLAERQQQIATGRINELRERTKMQPNPTTMQPGQQQRTSRGVTWSVE